MRRHPIRPRSSPAPVPADRRRGRVAVLGPALLLAVALLLAGACSDSVTSTDGAGEPLSSPLTQPTYPPLSVPTAPTMPPLPVPPTTGTTVVPIPGVTDIGPDGGCRAEVWAAWPGVWEEYRPSTPLGRMLQGPVPLFWPPGLDEVPAIPIGAVLAGDVAVFRLGPLGVLLHESVAAFLNAANEQVRYPARRHGSTDPFGTGVSPLQPAVAAAIASGDPARQLDLAETLRGLNDGVCPFG